MYMCVTDINISVCVCNDRYIINIKAAQRSRLDCTCMFLWRWLGIFSIVGTFLHTIMNLYTNTGAK